MLIEQKPYHPSQGNRRRHDIDHVDNTRRLSHLLTNKQAKKEIAYMEAVLKDVIRVHPGIGLLPNAMFHKAVPLPRDVIFQVGTIVGMNGWALHFSAKVFLSPPESIYVRWINIPSRKKAEMDNSFFTFGSRLRACIGQRVIC